jgi:hypothetical protein
MITTIIAILFVLPLLLRQPAPVRTEVLEME